MPKYVENECFWLLGYVVGAVYPHSRGHNVLFYRVRRAKASCCARLPLGPSCLSRGAAGEVPAPHGRIENQICLRRVELWGWNMFQALNMLQA